ncbi:MAG: hypothetical protein ABIK09_14370 [Pseudomonadota bacterium]
MSTKKLLSLLPGFSMDEVMTGTHEFTPGAGPEGVFPFEFRVRWGAQDMGAFLNPLTEKFMVNDMEGTVTVGGLCEDAPCRGTLALRYFKDQKIRYTFEFSVDGTTFRFIGEKVNILPWNLATSHTTCFGTLTDATGHLVSRSLTFFRLRSAPAFLASFRLAS